ncbi:MAG TPA: PxKF domain-containing protein [Intrasporangium sp.]|uniref:OmpL47-type beta-barrel domain-containing protein n=1 Tax=Intrasporangium sp. TaxID=1925024 RepID=UPI002D78B922|nr:PxKF domain-containing protein [Intrasporangium sp.]HET7398023.1 PxKF domain-containing protein [Intrasporangium sp.]
MALSAVALVLGGSLVGAPAAFAASVSGASFAGGAGTYTAANGTLYAKEGAPLTLTLNTDGNTQCVDVIDGTGTTIATQSASRGQAVWTFSGAAYPWLTAGSGSGLVAYTTKAWRNVNGNGKCTANQNETFGTKSAAYTLDNTAPTATGAVTPAPNGAGWNKADVTVTWTGADPGGSGVKSVTPASSSVTTEGTVDTTTTVTDNVGNTGTSATVKVKLDKTAPVIAGSRTPAPNANGWNNSDVTVSFTSTDATSGIKTSSGPTTLSASAAGQSVTGTAVDDADNSASATVSGINIDKVAPTLSGRPTTNPNAAGWYAGDVTVAWTATDALSGTTSPANSTISGEGTALTASATATDRAGNTSGSVQSAPAVRIDRTAPNTIVTAPPAWNKSDVTLSLVPNDGLSGVDKTYFQLDGGAQTAGTSVPVTTEGNHTLRFWSTDVAGNTEAAHTVSFGIDKTPPTIGHTQSPAANADGWNNGDVTVTFTCDDAVSGVASCTGPQRISTEGRAQPVTGTVTDNAGNTATDPASVSIDKTKPTITVDPLPAPNANGWYGDDVTATYTATDALSGVKTHDLAHTFGEGAAQTDTATATDAAGNTSSVTTEAVNVDKAAPTITGKVVGTPNPDGWFSGDVAVHWTCADALSGVVACPADSSVTGEGSDRSASASVSDKAGHLATATVDGIKIDRSAPTTTPSGVPAGWANAPVTVGLHASDNLSDVDSTYYAVDGATTPSKGSSVTVGAQGVHTVTYWSVDNAGNREQPQTLTVRLDLSAPSITPSQSPPQNTNGWNNTDVSVSFGCEDQTELSGLRSCPTPATVSTEGRAQKVSGTASDNAGNTATGTATVNLDKTAPTITGAPDRKANAAGWYKAPVSVSFDGADTLSGIDTVTGPQHLGEGANQSSTGTATDNAGNSASTSVTGINVDTTAPTLSAAPTSSPNGNGWYNTDVTQVWAADDALSGLAGPPPANSVLSTEGEGQTVTASVTDEAGNTTSYTSEPVRIDKTAPSTDVEAPSGWVNDSVTVTLDPHDNLSGVEVTHYAVDGGERQSGTSVTLAAEGVHTLTYSSSDNAGNVEDARTVTIRIDKSAPTISHTLSPEANGNGWNNADVTVTFSCDDQATLSGIASCTAPLSVSTEGKEQRVTGTATDKAGNTATDPATVSLDKTEPAITGHRSPVANEFGWNNTDVTVHFDGTDTLSGIDSVTAEKTFGEGTNQSLAGTAVDAAGNSASTTVGGINVDRTAPTLSGTPTAAANDNGWYRGDVTIDWMAGDDRSGVVATPAQTTIKGEGSRLTDTATVTDKAGNSTTAASAAVNIDRTAPTTGADAPAGWNNTAVTVSLRPHDGLSGVDATYYSLDGAAAVKGTALTVDTEGAHELRYWSVDKAGNTEEAQSTTVKIDLTQPSVGHTVTPPPNGSGWNNTSVKLDYQCSDALSGVASCSPDATVTTDGRNQAVPGTAVDNAGNTLTDNATVSIDTVKPTITGAPDRDANTNDWYAGDVTVSFSCDDALSGIAHCASPVRLAEGRTQSAKGTASDAAGNTADVTVGPINVDKTAPTLSGGATSSPNAAGWYTGDVTVKWTATDALSGLDGAAPADSTITGEGTGLTAASSVRDLAGNETSADSSPVKIDRTAPSTKVSDVSDWSKDAVTVQLTAGDNLSGVAATHYQLDSEPVREGTSIPIGTEGVHTLQVWSVDVAGNVEAQQNVEVKIDKTAPGISHTQAPAANERSWNNSDVTVTFTCTDGGSGIAGCTTPQTVTTQGQGLRVEGTAVDKAGNSTTDPATVSIDKTKPTLTGTLSADANANGWFKADVTATFTCADQDGLSGVVSCPAAKVLGEGKDQSASGTATDAADNDSDPLTIGGVNVDKTAPTLSGAATAASNGNGWYRDDVPVTWTASDALSGLEGGAPAASVVTGEGEGLSVGASVSDKAGNTTGATVRGIKIDRHDPSTSAVAPSGWQNTDVTVTLTADDNLSGVASTHYAVDGGAASQGTTVTVSTEGRHTVAYWSVDKAGNTETAKTVTVLVDKTVPTITGGATTSPNANGWYRGPVTVQFGCADSVSGIASCQPDATVAAEGANSVTGTAVDNAGNKGTTRVTGINVDTVAPVVTIGGITDGGVYILGAVPTATVTATDATSGLTAPATGTLTGGTASGVGTFTYTATATDKAGNVGTATLRYKVVYGYGATLFLQPVNDTAHQTSLSTSVFNAGQTIPMKFQLRNAAGQLVQAGTAPKWLVPVKGSATSAAVNETAYTTSATVGGTYAWDGTQYQYNWKTDKAQAGSYWRVGVALDDGQTYYVNIGLR